MKHNLKYYLSEGSAVGISLASSALTAYLTDKVTDSDAIISTLSSIGGTIGWVSGNIGIYVFLHRKEYDNRERSFKYDVKALFKSNLEGIVTTTSIRIPLQFMFQKYCGIYPAFAAPFAHIIGGVAGTLVRVIRNYQRSIVGSKKYRPH